MPKPDASFSLANLSEHPSRVLTLRPMPRTRYPLLERLERLERLEPQECSKSKSSVQQGTGGSLRKYRFFASCRRFTWANLIRSRSACTDLPRVRIRWRVARSLSTRPDALRSPCPRREDAAVVRRSAPCQPSRSFCRPWAPSR